MNASQILIEIATKILPLEKELDCQIFVEYAAHVGHVTVRIFSNKWDKKFPHPDIEFIWDCNKVIDQETIEMYLMDGNDEYASHLKNYYNFDFHSDHFREEIKKNKNNYKDIIQKRLDELEQEKISLTNAINKG